MTFLPDGQQRLFFKCDARVQVEILTGRIQWTASNPQVQALYVPSLISAQQACQAQSRSVMAQVADRCFKCGEASRHGNAASWGESPRDAVRAVK